MQDAVGLIGIGLLGSAVAGRLLAAGWRVRGYDINPERTAALAAMGGEAAESPADAAREMPVVVTCLMTAEIVRKAVLGEQGAASAMAPGSLLVDTTTCAPAESVAVAEELRPRGIALVDATVSGSSAVVSAGEAVVLAGGDPEAFARCEPLFATFTRRVLHVGPNGAGAAAKLVTNLVLGLNRLALAEGILLGTRAGLEPGVLLEVLRESAAYSRALDAKGERMVEGRFDPPDARLDQHLKDVRLILQLAEGLGVRLLASALHADLLAEASAQGLGDLDNSAVLAYLASLSDRQE